MDYGNMLGDSLGYAKDGLVGHWKRWILLIISTIIFPLIMGYTMEIWRGKTPAPEPAQWGKMFIDGLKLLVAAIIYAIPVILIILVFGGFAFFTAIQEAAMSGDPEFFTNNMEVLMPLVMAFMVGLLVAFIVAVILSLFSTIGFVRMARTERFGEAFNFGAILETIRKIGWGSYILALIILFIVAGIIWFVINLLSAIPFIGWLIALILLPFMIIFEARYITRVYEASGAVPAAS
ncbi:MAG: hypothetical protein A4E36_00532 [Methanoregulaceae archaeon PtaB.Bin009]|jgi:hypothetical protein|nr:MAG: hypothetical protein A4E36_00532 [Methanoregulaceae archaeon PtaB.Bin009]